MHFWPSYMTGAAAILILPARGCSISSTTSRALACGWSKVLAMLLMGANGSLMSAINHTRHIPLACQSLNPFLCRSLFQHIRAHGDDIGTVDYAVCVGCEALVRCPWLVEDFGAAKGLELAVVACRDHEEAVLGCEHLVWHDGGVRSSPSGSLLARDQVVGSNVGKRCNLPSASRCVTPHLALKQAALDS